MFRSGLKRIDFPASTPANPPLSGVAVLFCGSFGPRVANKVCYWLKNSSVLNVLADSIHSTKRSLRLIGLSSRR